MSKTSQENCSNCYYFDASKHENDKRTHHAGICSKWSEIVFKTSNCNQYFSVHQLPSEKIFEVVKIQNQQLTLL